MDSIQYFKKNDQVLWRYLLIWAREGLSIPKALHINVWEMVGVTAMAAGGEQTQSAHAGDVSLGARIDTIIYHNSRILLSHGYSPLWLWLQHNLIISWVNTSKLWTAYDAGLKKKQGYRNYWCNIYFAFEFFRRSGSLFLVPVSMRKRPAMTGRIVAVTKNTIGYYL